jgi:hypothetical protein
MQIALFCSIAETRNIQATPLVVAGHDQSYGRRFRFGGLKKIDARIVLLAQGMVGIGFGQSD